MFLLWIIIISIVTTLSAVIFAFMAGTTAFSITVVIDSFRQLLMTNMLLFLTFMPLIFITLKITNLVPAMIGGAILTFTNMIISSSIYGIYFPYSIPYLIASGEILEYTTNYIISYIILMATFLLGLLLSYTYFTRSDVPI